MAAEDAPDAAATGRAVDTTTAGLRAALSGRRTPILGVLKLQVVARAVPVAEAAVIGATEVGPPVREDATYLQEAGRPFRAEAEAVLGTMAGDGDLRPALRGAKGQEVGANVAATRAAKT